MEWHIGVWPLLKLTLRPKINQNPNRNMLHYLTREANLMDVLQCLAAEVSCFHQSGSSSRSVAGWCPTEMFGGLMWFVTTINPEPWRTCAYSYNPWVFDGRCQNFLEIGEAVDPWKNPPSLMPWRQEGPLLSTAMVGASAWMDAVLNSQAWLGISMYP